MIFLPPDSYRELLLGAFIKLQRSDIMVENNRTVFFGAPEERNYIAN
jgi:hypothetical protein